MPVAMFLEEVHGKVDRIASQVQTINRSYNLTIEAVLPPQAL